MKYRKQRLEKDILIKAILTPDMRNHIKIVSPEDFSKMENNKMEKDYVCITGDMLFISSKADYDNVIIVPAIIDQSKNGENIYEKATPFHISRSV